MPNVCYYREAISPQIVKQQNGRYALLGIPIFECHNREDIHCDEKWMQACISDQREKKARGFLPRLIIGHTSDQPGATEKPAEAFLDNYRYNATERWLYADFVDVPESLLGEIKGNKWPGRSVEANREKPAIDVVALLGGTPPYFKLPDLKYGAADDKTVLIFSECHMAKNAIVKKDESPLRKMYEALRGEFRKAYSMPDAMISGADAAEDADYQRFCALMDRYIKDKEAREKSPVTKPEEEKTTDEDYQAASQKAMWAKVDNAGGKGENDDEYDKSKMKGNWSSKAQGEKVTRYADTPEYKAIIADNAKLIERIDKLEADNTALYEKQEADAWTVKYSALPIPKSRLDLENRVKELMELPAEKRQMYFDRSVRDISPPEYKPINPDDKTAGKAKAGSEEEAAAIRKLYADNKERFKGDYAAAQREYRNSK